MDNYKPKKSNFVKLKAKKDYSFLKEIGKGGFGIVFLAQSKKNGQKYAVKAIPKDEISKEDNFQNEMLILKSMDHPNIIQLYEFYESVNTIYLVTELCEGGELFKYIIDKKYLSEDNAAKIARQITSAIAYCHDNKIVHRDLKPENFLLKYKDDINSIKLIDFGLSVKFSENEWISDPNGTPYYIAPEMIEGQYSFHVDNWALGVIIYIMLSGEYPFFGKNPKDIILSIKKGIYTFSKPPFVNSSIEVKDLISKLLIRDPKKRFTALQAYQHPWIKREIDKESEGIEVDKEVFNNLQNIIEAQAFLKNVMLMGMAFYQKMSLLKLNLEEKKLEQLFNAMDLDKSGVINYSEFLASFANNIIYKNENHLINAFKAVDLDKSGKINKEELRNLLYDDVLANNVDLDELIKEADTNHDGEIDYNEFVKLMRSKYSD